MAKKKLAEQKKRRYVVGYGGVLPPTVWGQRAFIASKDGRPEDYCKTMNKQDAIAALDDMNSRGAAVYELVLVK